MLDRRLMQDDWRGLNEGVTDNQLTKSSFFMVFENKHGNMVCSINLTYFVALYLFYLFCSLCWCDGKTHCPYMSHLVSSNVAFTMVYTLIFRCGYTSQFGSSHIWPFKAYDGLSHPYCNNIFKVNPSVQKGLKSIKYTVKPVLSDHPKEDQKLVFKTDYRLMQIKSIAECSKRAFCNTFDLH